MNKIIIFSFCFCQIPRSSNLYLSLQDYILYNSSISVVLNRYLHNVQRGVTYKVLESPEAVTTYKSWILSRTSDQRRMNSRDVTQEQRHEVLYSTFTFTLLPSFVISTVHVFLTLLFFLESHKSSVGLQRSCRKYLTCLFTPSFN